jgi:hypothetical protein
MAPVRMRVASRPFAVGILQDHYYGIMGLPRMTRMTADRFSCSGFRVIRACLSIACLCVFARRQGRQVFRGKKITFTGVSFKCWTFALYWRAVATGYAI